MTTRTREAKVQTGYDASKFPAFAVTADVVILTMAKRVFQVLLVRRGEEPFKGMWAVPGGFKRPEETLDERVFDVVIGSAPWCRAAARRCGR